MKLTLGISPCPNDTFIFDALVNGALDTGGIELEVFHEDVETLNEWAIEGRLDVTKVSYGVVPRVLREYAVLEAGGALGRGVGPLLVARPDAGPFRPEAATVAVPGRHTTANLLFSLAYPRVRAKRFLVFSEIERAVLAREVDAGVLIHEGRFTYAAKGLARVEDLGAYWERETGAPVPLGGILGRRRLGAELLRRVDALVRESLLRARARPGPLPEYVRRHAQEMDESVMRRHVELYVNEHSLGLGAAGRRAVEALLRVAAREDPGPALPPDGVFLGGGPAGEPG
jgi:1,4-dihydroxy-6-naphthoate synthase